LSSVRRLIQRRSGERAIYTEGRSGRTVIDADLTAAVARWDPVVAELGEGAVVALSSMDPLVFATTYLGLLAAGATVAPLDPGASPEGARQDLTELGATALVADGALSMVAGGGRRAGEGGVQLQVRDGQGIPVSPEAVGQVHIRGAGVIPGALQGGWLATGDLARQDAEGYLYLTGRVSEVINRGGEKLFPRHIEDVLTGDPQIALAVVVGQPDDVLGEVPVAYVVPHRRSDAAIVAATARERCSRLLSRAQQPTDIRVVDSLPTGATGKVNRQLVRELGSAV